MLNSVCLMGRLTADPELRTTNSGQSVCRFCLAVERSIRSADGERKTDFINCLVWAKSAEFLASYFRKGQYAVVQGELQQIKWEKDGEIRSGYEVKVDRIHFGGDKPNTDFPPARDASPAPREESYGQQRIRQLAEEGKPSEPAPVSMDELIDEQDLPF